MAHNLGVDAYTWLAGFAGVIGLGLARLLIGLRVKACITVRASIGHTSYLFYKGPRRVSEYEEGLLCQRCSGVGLMGSIGLIGFIGV